MGKLTVLASLTLLVASSAIEQALAQPYANPYRSVADWAKPPEGRRMGRVGDVAVDPDGRHLWAIVRCDPEARFGSECLDSDLDPILKFDPQGNVVQSFGAGLFVWPHGMDIDHEGNIWVTDGIRPEWTPPGTRGHQVIKFDSAGKVLMTLGTPGVAGDGPNHFNAPCDVVVSDSGDVFVADGHAADGNNRVVKFSSYGKFIKAWGKTGYAPGEFRLPHTIAIDSQGRVFVGDRENSRIQIFDQEGKHLSTWRQFGRPSGITFDEHGKIYVADSTSDNEKNPGFEYGIRIGDARTGWVDSLVLFPWGDPRVDRGHGAEWVAVDAEGNLFGGEPYPRRIQKYARARR